MKKFLPILLITCCAAFAADQPNPIYEDAVRAFKAGEYDTARTLFEAVLATEPKNAGAQNHLRMIALREKGIGVAGLESSLRKVMLPKVDLREASAKEAFAFVAQQIEKQTDGKQKLNVVWMVPQDAGQLVTLNLQNVPATEVLRYIADSASLKLDYETYALRVQPAVVQ